MHSSGSKPEDPSPAQAPAEVIVRLNGQIHRLKYHSGDTLLETMRKAGLAAPSACEQGLCGTCMVRRIRGSVSLRENHVLGEDDLAQGYTLACQGIPVDAECEIEIGS